MRFCKLICVFTALTLLTALFCGCKDKNTASGSSESVSSSETMGNAQNGDMLDPENTDEGGSRFGTGTEVKADDLYHQSGKANGIDVSKWQGKINWSEVKKSGIDFAVIRIGYRGENGVIFKDSFADYNIQQADKAGILVGVYFFSTAKSTAEATEEAKWTVSAIEGYSISYPVVYDCEGFDNADSRMYGLTNAQRTDNAAAFLGYISEKGYDAMLYAAVSELANEACWDTARIESEYKIWVARYTATPYPQSKNPDYSGKYDMWQYTNLGKVSGIEGNTDMIVSFFTKEKAAAKKAGAAPGTASAPKEEDNIYSAANDEVTAKELTNLRSAAGTKSSIIATLKNGTFIKRTGIGSNGWSRLIYNGKTVYAITSYLTTDRSYKPPVTEQSTASNSSQSDGFAEASGKYTAKEETNLRTEPSTSAAIAATIKNGEFADRIGMNPNGWTKLLYNGKTVYAKTNLLTTEVNKTESQVSSAVSSTAPDDGFKAANDKVTAKEETNLRAAPSGKDGVEILYVLKNGEYVQRTGINETSGWSKLLWNGKTVYAVTSYLQN